MSRLIEIMLASDRVSGTDADRHEDISHNGSSEFRGNADSAEMANLDAVIQLIMRAMTQAVSGGHLGRVLINRPAMSISGLYRSLPL
jgi:hypothetical protein